MREYYGDSAQKYGQPQDKYFTLFPAIEKLMPLAGQGQSAIDLGCGTGVLYELIATKGYVYAGVDISPDMLAQARINNPQGFFVRGDVTKPLPEIEQKFDVVISNMLLPSIGTKSGFEDVFAVASTLLKTDGIMIATAGHPCFDGYMQKHFLKREDIETDFEGYFKSGANYQVHRALEDRVFTFSDYHWTLTDYYQSTNKAGLQIVGIDECPLVGEPTKEVQEKFFKKGSPSYIVFLIKKLANQSGS